MNHIFFSLDNLFQKTNKNEVPGEHLIFFKFNVYEHIRQGLVNT